MGRVSLLLDTIGWFQHYTVAGLVQYTVWFWPESWPYGVNLFFHSCLDNTVAPSFTTLSPAQRLSSPYSFPFPWLHCLYHVLLGHPLGIFQSLVYGYKAYCLTGVLQGLLQLCCVESFCSLLGNNQVLLSNFSSLFAQSLSSSVESGSVLQLLRLPETKAESLVCVQCFLLQ